MTGNEMWQAFCHTTNDEKGDCALIRKVSSVLRENEKIKKVKSC